MRDPLEASVGAHAIYPEVWTTMDSSDGQEERTAELGPYAVTRGTMELARADAVLLHCLPAYRGREVESAVLDGVQSAAWKQAANRLPTTQALFYWLLATAS